MNLNTIIKSEIKKYKIAISITLVLTILSILSLCLSKSMNYSAKKNALYFGDVKTETYDITYIEPVDISSAFYYHAEDNQSYRLVKDKKGNYFLINVYESNVQDIISSGKKIYGTKREIKDDVLEKLTEKFNEAKLNVTKEDVKKIYGVYFDSTRDEDGVAILFYIFGLIFIFLGPIFLLIYLCYFMAFKKSLKQLNKDTLDEVNNELNGNIKEYKKLQLILTNNYLISHAKKLVCIKYSDIFMIYKNRVSTNRQVNYFLYIADKFGNSKNISQLNQFQTNYLEEFDDVIDFVADKNPEVLIGNNPENKELLKELKKELKRKK